MLSGVPSESQRGRHLGINAQLDNGELKADCNEKDENGDTTAGLKLPSELYTLSDPEADPKVISLGNPPARFAPEGNRRSPA